MKQTKLLLLLLLLMAIPARTQAYTNGEIVKKDGFIYKVIDVANFTVSFVGTEDSQMGAITVPYTWNDGKGTTFTVTEVGGSETHKCKNITKVTLPEGILKMNSACFGGAELAELHIPSTVTQISQTAFYNSKSLPKITVASSSTSFMADADGALYSKDKKDLYLVPSGIAPTGGTYTIDPDVEHICHNAFMKADNVTKIVLPQNLQEVESSYPSFVTNCIKLTAFEMSPSASSPFRVIDGVLFENNTLVSYPQAKPTQNYQVPAGITEIAERGIEGSRYMKTIDLNDVVKLNQSSIISNSNLETVRLPKNLQLENVTGAINNNPKISAYEAPDDCVNFDVIDGVVYSKGDHSTLYFFPPAKTVTDGKYTVPSYVKTIEKNAFAGNKNIKELTVSANVERIAENAFRNSVLLEKVTFEEPSHVTTIEQTAFGWCDNLKSFTLPTALTELRNAFMYSENLETINIPDGSKLTTIRENTFTANKNLKNFNFEGDCDLKTIGENAFAYTKLESFNFPKGVTNIKNNAFIGCTNMTTAEFADDAIITTIGAGAFADCGLTAISIPNSVTSLQKEAFRNCSALSTVNVSENLTDISPEAFKYCENLEDINVDKKNPAYSSVDGYLLTKNKKTLVLFPHGKAHARFTLLPPSITKIGDFAFLECINLTNVMIPNKVESIGDRAFSLCKNLNTIAFLCDEPIDPANIDQRPNHKSFDDGTAGTTNMMPNIDIYVRKDIESAYEAIPFYSGFKSINTSFEENGNEYLQVASNVADLLSVKSEDWTYIVPEKTTTGLDVALIGDYAFQSASNKIHEVVVKNHIEYVGAKAFMTDINNNASTIENVFFISGNPSKKMLSTTRFELDETGSNYNEFASTTNIFVKKSKLDAYKTVWKKDVYKLATNTYEESPYNFYNQIDYKIKGTPALTNKMYSTFSREFDVDLGDSDDSGNSLFWDTAADSPKVIAFTAGEQRDFVKDGEHFHYIYMTSINLHGPKTEDGLYVPANTGVVLKAIDGHLPADFYYRIGEKDLNTYGDANVMKPVTVNSKNLMATTEDGHTNLYLSNNKVYKVAQSAQFKSEGKLTLGVHKAYMNIDLPLGAKAMLVFDDNSELTDETTGIADIEQITTGKDGVYYNLQGQKVSKPAQGIYIHNGKKVIVK